MAAVSSSSSESRVLDPSNEKDSLVQNKRPKSSICCRICTFACTLFCCFTPTIVGMKLADKYDIKHIALYGLLSGLFLGCTTCWVLFYFENHSLDCTPDYEPSQV